MPAPERLQGGKGMRLVLGCGVKVGRAYFHGRRLGADVVTRRHRERHEELVLDQFVEIEVLAEHQHIVFDLVIETGGLGFVGFAEEVRNRW